MKANNIVYWITKSFYETLSNIDVWCNDIYYAEGQSFQSVVDCAFEHYIKEKPTHFAIVTDAKDYDLSYIYSKFLSNNVILIKDSYDKNSIEKQINWIISDFGKEKVHNNKTLFISDTHFNHKNIIQYCNRPWNSGEDSEGNLIITDEDVAKMNEAIISNWNSVVGKDDIVWHLGDFCLGKNQKEEVPKFVSKLNGKINIVLGNHDNHNVKFYYDCGFNRVYDRKIIINNFVVLSHAPMEFVKAPFFNIFGHVHDVSTYNTFSKDSCCVCVERHNYTPISWKEIELKYKELNSEN